jgi:hypothetical protein
MGIIMKRLLIVAFILIASEGFSQENVIKLGLANTIYGDYSLSYERMINSNNSVTLKVGYLQPTSSLFIEPVNFSTDEFSVKSVDGGFHSSVEYRFYFGKSKAPQGFYVAPYARYGQINGVYTDMARGTQFDVSSTGSMFGVGAQLGAQWLINDLISIDFSFFGAGIERYCAKLKYTTSDHSDYDYNNITGDIKNYVEEINYLAKRLTLDVNNPTNMVAKLPFLFPGFRFSISIGVAF